MMGDGGEGDTGQQAPHTMEKMKSLRRRIAALEKQRSVLEARLKKNVDETILAELETVNKTIEKANDRQRTLQES